jgi:hypothetical protein
LPQPGNDDPGVIFAVVFAKAFRFKTDEHPSVVQGRAERTAAKE